MTATTVRESAVLAKARRILTIGVHPGKCMKTTGQGEPDLVCVRDGVPIVCETKRDKKKPTVLQKMRLREWAHAGAFAVWTDGVLWLQIMPDGEERRIDPPIFVETVELTEGK